MAEGNVKYEENEIKYQWLVEKHLIKIDIMKNILPLSLKYESV